MKMGQDFEPWGINWLLNVNISPRILWCRLIAYMPSKCMALPIESNTVTVLCSPSHPYEYIYGTTIDVTVFERAVCNTVRDLGLISPIVFLLFSVACMPINLGKKRKHNSFHPPSKFSCTDVSWESRMKMFKESREEAKSTIPCFTWSWEMSETVSAVIWGEKKNSCSRDLWGEGR